MSTKPAFQTHDDSRGAHLIAYVPLITLVSIAALAGLATAMSTDLTMMRWMHYFMGFFLCTFAMLKLFHPNAFADGFEMYDLLAKRFRGYGYIYPYIELILGLGYLSFLLPEVTYTLTIIVLTFGAIGVLKALKEGLDINCPCMGSVLDVPLSTVTLTEDLAMVGMAIALLIMV